MMADAEAGQRALLPAHSWTLAHVAWMDSLLLGTRWKPDTLGPCPTLQKLPWHAKEGLHLSTSFG